VLNWCCFSWHALKNLHWKTYFFLTKLFTLRCHFANFCLFKQFAHDVFTLKYFTQLFKFQIIFTHSRLVNDCFLSQVWTYYYYNLNEHFSPSNLLLCANVNNMGINATKINATHIAALHDSYKPFYRSSGKVNNWFEIYCKTENVLFNLHLTHMHTYDTYFITNHHPDGLYYNVTSWP
jgi:hypothetical protein